MTYLVVAGEPRGGRMTLLDRVRAAAAARHQRIDPSWEGAQR